MARHQTSSPHTDALGLCSQDTAEQQVCLSHSPLPFPSAHTPRNRLPTGCHHAGFCSTLESKWILSPMPKLVRYIHKGPRGLCLSNSGYLHFYFNLDGDECQQMTSPRCTLKPSAPYTLPNVLQSHRAICPQVWFCTGSLGFQFGQSSPQASSTVGRHKARDPRNTAIILRLQAYGKQMPNTVSQSKITAENSFGKNIHGHSGA